MEPLSLSSVVGSLRWVVVGTFVVNEISSNKIPSSFRSIGAFDNSCKVVLSGVGRISVDGTDEASKSIRSLKDILSSGVLQFGTKKVY